MYYTHIDSILVPMRTIVHTLFMNLFTSMEKSQPIEIHYLMALNSKLGATNNMVQAFKLSSFWTPIRHYKTSHLYSYSPRC